MSVIYYRTKDGLADYQFRIEELSDGTWRAYIVSQPSYRDRDTGLHATHRLTDGGRYYVCWDRRLRSEHESREVSAVWADATQQYIRSGTRF